MKITTSAELSNPVHSKRIPQQAAIPSNRTTIRNKGSYPFTVQIKCRKNSCIQATPNSAITSNKTTIQNKEQGSYSFHI